MGKTTFIAAGDAFITRRLPEGGYEGFPSLTERRSASGMAWERFVWNQYNRPDSAVNSDLAVSLHRTKASPVYGPGHLLLPLCGNSP